MKTGRVSERRFFGSTPHIVSWFHEEGVAKNGRIRSQVFKTWEEASGAAALLRAFGLPAVASELDGVWIVTAYVDRNSVEVRVE